MQISLFCVASADSVGVVFVLLLVLGLWLYSKLHKHFGNHVPDLGPVTYRENRPTKAADISHLIQHVQLDLNGFKGNLYRFQDVGARFLIHARRCLLGDEMGLGKTVQALAALNHLNRAGEVNRVIVVAPKTLLYNWQAEIERFTGFKVFLLAGPPAARAKAYAEFGKAQRAIGLLNYDLARTDFPLYRTVFETIDAVVLDEAHLIKNESTQRHIFTTKIVVQAKYAFYLTGTVFQNNLEEFSVLAKTLGQWAWATRNTPEGVFKRKVEGFYFRRKKVEVFADLPAKVETDILLDFEPEQLKSYVRTLNSGESGFAVLSTLRQTCNFCPTKGSSPKLEYLLAQLEELKGGGRKALVFSEFLEPLNRIQKETGTPFKLDGQVEASRRQEMVEEFGRSRQHHVMLLQIRTGGMGLNLQAADTVFLFDPGWNPAVENQAIDRAHRIGQTQRVSIYRLLMRRSIEERIRGVAMDKQATFDAYADGSLLEQRLKAALPELLELERKAHRVASELSAA